jgi:uncharacterized protein YdaU (DUF1376 family)
MLFGDDFMSGCRKAAMTPEQVGMYIFMLLLEWTDKAPLEDDPKRLSVRTGWDVRIVRRLVNELVGLTKYDREDGHLSNERMQREIAIYVTKAKAKEARKGNTSRVDVAQLSDSSPIATPQLTDSYPTAGEHLSEKDNENNGGVQKTTRYTRARQNQIPEPEADSVCVLGALNGAAYPMLESITAWMPHMDDPCAREWLRKTILNFGEQPTKEAFQTVTTRIAEGRPITHPLRLWSKIAGTMAENAKAADPPKNKLKAALDKQREKMRIEHGWAEEVTHG